MRAALMWTISDLLGYGMLSRALCALVIHVNDMTIWQERIVEIICKIERIFPPSFFDSMEHLPIHLPYEARVGGPMQFQ
ncbi:hypothetical protein SLE2022_348370 [Rubroshorea leprosula]